MQRESVNERSPARFAVTWQSESGESIVPISLSYRVDDVISGTNIVPLTSATPGLPSLITIAPTENLMVDPTRPSEVRRVTWVIDEGEVDETHGDMLYDLINLARVT